jgi:hypothetical protein
MPRGFHPRRQGDIGEATAVEWLTRIGASVCLPLFHSPDYDLIADLDGSLLRVQVKTSSCRHQSTNHFAVQLATSGGNRSWTGVRKEFDPARADFLFVLVEDGRRWFIPSVEIGGRHSICLGGEKYSEFQVGRSDRIPPVDGGGSRLDSARGGAGVGEPGRPVKSVAQPEWVRFPPPPPPPPSGGASRSGTHEPPAVGRTKMSSHHQVAVPRTVAAACRVQPGDRFRVESAGEGRFLMTRIEEYMQQYTAQLELPEEARDRAG